LEAVNFLVSSGNCFVVLGMDRVQVQRAAGLSFKDVAEEAGPSQAKKTAASAATPQAIADAAAETAREKRAEFAQKYLEKLVNLEVRVPLAEGDKVKQGLFEKDPVAKEISFQEKSLRAGLRTLRWGVPTGRAATLGFLSLQPISSICGGALDGGEPGATSHNRQLANCWDSDCHFGTSSDDSHNDKVECPCKGQSRRARRRTSGALPRPRECLHPKNSMAGTLDALSSTLSGSSVFVAGRECRVDNPAGSGDARFAAVHRYNGKGEKVWYTLVLEKQNTPRAAKRFVNRVRYLAMRQHYYRDQSSLWDRTLFPQRLASPAR
jgi:hypothetical protein